MSGRHLCCQSTEARQTHLSARADHDFEQLGVSTSHPSDINFERHKMKAHANNGNEVSNSNSIVAFRKFPSELRHGLCLVPYLDGVEGVSRDDGADAAEPAGQKVLHLAHPLLLRHVAGVGN